MKLPPKLFGPLPVSHGEPVDGDYYEACNGLVVICRPLMRKRPRRNAPYEWASRKSGPWHCVLKASGLAVQIGGERRIVFTSVARAVAFAEAVVPLLILFDVDPTSKIPVPANHKLPRTKEALWQLYITITLGG